MKHQIVKKITTKAVAFAIALALCAGLTACQSGGGQNADMQTGAQAGTQQQQSSAPTAEEGGDAVSMGRYVEKQAELGEGMEGHSYMVRDGKNVKMFAYGSTFYTSEDNGDTWSGTELEWYEKLQEDNYVMQTAFTNDGTYAIQYSPLSKREDTLKEGMAGDMGVDTESSEDEGQTKLDPHLMIVSPDGTQKEVPVQFSSDDMYARQLHFTQDGRLFMVTFNKGVYEVDVETGALNRLCTIEDNAMTMEVQGKLLMLVTYDGVLLYDMEGERFLEDEVLDDFVKETYNGATDYGNCYNMYAFFGTEDENAVYIAGGKGLHRHVIGGAAVEQVIEPGLSSFGNPSRDIVHAIALENEEFLAQFSDGAVVKFYYDETVPTVPSDRLSVYSLKGNDTVRQAIAAYQTANPGVFVEYEAALDADGITREDALKNLSTRLLNGEGPDVLILDEMPIDTYVEKGILMDMSDIVTEVKNSDGLYENVVEPFVTDGKIYVVPMEFQLPLVMGDNRYVEQSRTYEGYAQAVEALRGENPEGMIISDCNEQGITRRFLDVCAPAWKNEDGSINEKNIRAFMEQTKKIFDAQMSGLTQKQMSEYNDNVSRVFQSGGSGQQDEIDWLFYWKMIEAGDFMYHDVKMSSGTAYSMDKFAESLSMPRNEGCENISIGLFDGQSEGVYMAETLTGINAQSKNAEAAKSFVKLMLSEEIQTSTFRGLPINKAAFETALSQYDDTLENEEAYMMYGGSDQEGNSWFWESWWLDDAQKQQVRDWAAQAKTPHITDVTLEDAVESACTEYLKGRLSLDDAVSQVRSSTAIYMSE